MKRKRIANIINLKVYLKRRRKFDKVCKKTNDKVFNITYWKVCEKVGGKVWDKVIARIWNKIRGIKFIGNLLKN